MSVIAWDGNCIAADKRMSQDHFGYVGSKLFEIIREETRYIVGWTGVHENGLLLLQWFQQGARLEEWPNKCQTKEDWCRLVILDTQQKRITTYEQFPIAFPLSPENPFMAWGAGRDFAMGAMAAGKNAVEAVEIASRFNSVCGNGVDAFYLNKELHNGSSYSHPLRIEKYPSHSGY